MPSLLWDQIGDRQFQAGLDRGVLYFETKDIIEGGTIPYDIEFVGEASAAGNTSSLDITLPTVETADFALIAVVASSEPTSVPSGWSSVGTVTNGSLNIFLYKRMVIAVDSGWVMTFGFGGVTKVAISVVVYRNVIATTPIHVSGTSTQSGTAHPTTTSLVTTEDACVRVAIAADRGSPGSPSSWSWASPFAIRNQISNSSGGATSVTIADDLTPLVTGSIAGTTATSTNSLTGATILLLLQPKAPAVTEDEIIYEQTAIPWNGLISIDEDHNDEKSSPLYLDGNKYYDIPGFEDYASTLNVFTYPDEFLPFAGFFEGENGVYFDDQPVSSFHLCYRTKLGNDINGIDLGYRIHILYNLTAAPVETTFETLSDTVSPTTFSWGLSSVPMKLGGYRPSSHIIIDSTLIEADLLSTLEDKLYGTELDYPELPTIEELYEDLMDYRAIIITYNGDGTWTADGPADLIEVVGDTFTINSNRAFYRDANEFDIWSSAE